MYYPPSRAASHRSTLYRPSIEQAIVGYVGAHGRVHRRRIVAYLELMYGYRPGAIAQGLHRLGDALVSERGIYALAREAA